MDIQKFIGPPIGNILLKILPDCPHEIMNKLILSFREEYDGHGWMDTLLYSGVKDTLKQLTHKYMCGCYIVTNKPSLPSRRILEKTKIGQYISDIISPDSIRPNFATKAEMLASLIDRQLLLRKNTVFVGDSEEDARSAHENRLRFVAVSYGYGNAHSQNNYPKYRIINNINELSTLVNDRNEV